MGRILIAGCGYVGEALGARLIEDGHEVFGLRRKPRSLPARIQPIEADLADRRALRALPEGLDQVFYLVSPSGSEDTHYRHAYVVPGESRPRAMVCFVCFHPNSASTSG